MSFTPATPPQEPRTVPLPDPPLARWMFGSTRSAWLWLLVRVIVGYQWLDTSVRNLADPTWMDGSGAALRASWEMALATQPPAERATWLDQVTRGLLQTLLDSSWAGWLSRAIVSLEALVGLALILGAFVGIAGAIGLVLSGAALLVGVFGPGPLLAVAQLLIVLAWKNAGYLGFDRYLLPGLGTPWPQPRPRRHRPRMVEVSR